MEEGIERGCLSELWKNRRNRHAQIRRAVHPVERGMAMSPQRLLEVDFTETRTLHITSHPSNCAGKITLKPPRHKLPRQLDCPTCGQKLWDFQYEATDKVLCEDLLISAAPI